MKNTIKIFCKNPLTNRIEDDIIVKLTHSRTSSKMKMLQKNLKNLKKVLTNDEECDILYRHSKLKSECKSES